MFISNLVVSRSGRKGKNEFYFTKAIAKYFSKNFISGKYDSGDNYPEVLKINVNEL